MTVATWRKPVYSGWNIVSITHKHAGLNNKVYKNLCYQATKYIVKENFDALNKVEVPV